VNWLDILLAVILIGSVIGGLKTGFVRSVIGLVALVVGLLAGLWFYGSVGSLLYDWIRSRHVANFAGFFIILTGVLVLGALIGAFSARLLKLARLSWLDHLLGGAFGILRGALIGAVIVLAIMAFAQNSPPRSVVDSRLAPYMVGVADVIAYAAPYEVKEGFRRSYEQVKKLWADAVRRGVRKLPEEREF